MDPVGEVCKGVVLRRVHFTLGGEHVTLNGSACQSSTQRDTSEGSHVFDEMLRPKWRTSA